MALQAIKLRLPGTTNTVNIYAQQAITARQVKTKTKEQHHVKDIGERKVVLVPTTVNPGRIIEDDQVVDIDPDDVLELWKQPYLVNLVLAGGQSSQGGREIAVDYAVPSLQRACNLDEEFVFKQLEPTKKESQGIVKILNANQSLEEQNFGADSWLIICPLKIFLKPLNALTDVVKEGVLFKRSNKKKEKLNEGSSGNSGNSSSSTNNLNAVGSGADSYKYTSEQRRWVTLLKDAVLIYYKNKEDPKPAGVIPLEYFTIRFIATPISNSNANNGSSGGIGNGYRFSLQLKRHFSGVEKTKTVYILSVPIEKDSNYSSTDILREWYEAIKKFSKLDEKETKVFGIELKELVLRSKIQTGSDIPPIIRDIVSYLDNNGLDEEGLFRQSGNASLIETYRQYYDAGVNVLLKDLDPHTVAGLLKRFFRELPEPLLTFELYDEFIKSHSSELERKEKLSKLLEAVKKLPEENQVILKFITSFFGRIAQNSSVNKMNKSNLGIVFGPNLIRPKDQQSVDNYSIINDITLTLIEEYSHIFISPNNQQNSSASGGNFSSLRKPVPSSYNTGNSSSSSTPSPSSGDQSVDGQFLKEGVLLTKDISNGKTNNWKECSKSKLVIFGTKSKENQIPKLTFDLKLSLVGNSSEKQFCFVLQQGPNIVFLAASSNNEFEEWMKVISNAIAECNSSSSPPSNIISVTSTPSSNPTPSSPTPPSNNANISSSSNAPASANTNSPTPVNNGNNNPPPIGPKPKKLPPGAVAVPGFSTAVVQQFKESQSPQSPQSPRQAQGSGIKGVAKPVPTPQQPNANNQQQQAPAKVPVSQASRRPTSPNPVRPTSPGPSVPKPVTNPADRTAISPSPRRKLPDAPSSNNLNPSTGSQSKDEEKLKELNTLLAEERASRVHLEKLVKTLESKLREEAQTRQKLEVQVKELSTKLSSLMSAKKTAKKVKAIYSYEAEEDNELNFQENDILEIINEDPSGWWEAELNGKKGLVPAVYLSPLEYQ